MKTETFKSEQMKQTNLHLNDLRPPVGRDLKYWSKDTVLIEVDSENHENYLMPKKTINQEVTV